MILVSIKAPGETFKLWSFIDVSGILKEHFQHEESIRSVYTMWLLVRKAHLKLVLDKFALEFKMCSVVWS